MGIKLKYDVQINLKHEKEIFRFVRFIILEFIFSWFFLGISTYIWNMTWYWIAVFLGPWCAAIPAIINLKVRKIQIREIVGKHVMWQFFTGCGIAVIFGVVMSSVSLILGYGMLPQTNDIIWWKVVRTFFYYMCVVGPTEELIYRVTIMGCLREICEKYKWLAPFVANTLFALSHLLYRDWIVTGFAFLYGAVYTILAYRWKRCGWVLLSAMHGMYDFSVMMLPYLYLTIIR